MKMLSIEYVNSLFLVEHSVIAAIAYGILLISREPYVLVNNQKCGNDWKRNA